MNGVNYLTKADPPPFAHQRDSFYKHYGQEGFALLFDVGCGKSRALIDIAANLYAEGKINAVLLIAPSGVHRQWVAEQLPEHCPIPYTSYIYRAGTGKQKQKDFTNFNRDKSSFRWLATNVEVFSRDTYVPDFRQFLLENNVLAVIDEASRIKHIEATRTQNIIMRLSDLTTYGKRVVARKPLAKYRAILTGTPVSQSPFDLYSMFEFLYPNFFKLPFTAFKARYGILKSDTVPGSQKKFLRKLSLRELKTVRDAHSKGMKIDRICSFMGITPEDANFIITHPDVQACYKNLPELKALIAPYASIVRKEDALDLPPQSYEKVYVEMSEEQDKIYKKMAKDLEVEYQGVELTALNALTLVVRLAQITSGFLPSENGEVLIGGKSAKVEALCDKMEDDGIFPCIVMSRFLAEVREAERAIRDRFPELTVAVVIGDVEQVERQEILARFKRGEIDVLIATQKTIGTGYNLFRASVTYYLSNDFNFEDREQSEGRTHRQGSTADKVSYIDFIVPGTVDERVYSVLREKRSLLEYMRTSDIRHFMGGK